jgi:hypothetical protein
VPLVVLLLVLICCLSTPTLQAQQPDEGQPWSEVFAGSERERYLRILQLAGKVEAHPWSIRSLGPRSLDRLVPVDSAHPWARRFPVDAGAPAGTDLRLLEPGARSIFNSGFPDGDNDGPIWAGRGLTVAATAGVSLRHGPLSAVLAPVVFHAQNAAFGLKPNGLEGRLAYGDGHFPTGIDRPQRFGEGGYSRIDAGQSTVRLDVGGVAAGVSSANVVWGPSDAYPLLLGTNAPGFLHVFVGSSRPVDVRVGSLHIQALWGALEQSGFSTVEDTPRRLGTGWVALFAPAGFDGLELGGARFYHVRWPREGLSGALLRRPFEPLLKVNVEERGPEEEDNQLASVFARWVFPRSGFEFYGEYAREDHNWHLRDFILEPDHSSGLLLGTRKVWTRSDTHWWVAGAELLNAGRSHLVRIRDHGPFYHHHAIRQGHTHRGQVLGSPAAIGGGGFRVALESYFAGGAWRLTGRRELRADRPTTQWDGLVYPRSLDVLYGVDVERVVFRGPFEIGSRLGWSYNLDRDFALDRQNLSLEAAVRYRPAAPSESRP